jgi:predicted MFS family arabinose efflux permease
MRARDLSAILLGVGVGWGAGNIAAALGLGSALADAGVDWRVGFAISAAVCVTPLLVLPERLQGAPASPPDRAFIGSALRASAMWRLLALFIAANGVPLIVSAWLVAYLTRHAGVQTAAAGALAFLVFGLTALVRPVGARLAGAGRPFGLLAGGGTLVATVGLLALAASTSLAVGLIAVMLMGVGFALPYAVMVDAAARLFPDRATATLALVQTGPNVVPMVAIPLVGSALENGHAPLAFIVLAAFVAIVGVLNLSSPSLARQASPATSAGSG